jgi:hypothetical protein
MNLKYIYISSLKYSQGKKKIEIKIRIKFDKKKKAIGG